MPEISIRAETLISIGTFPVTNSLVLSIVALIVLLGVAFFVRRNLKLVPGKTQALAEISLEKLLGLMDTVLGERHLSERYLPLIATIFLFILTSNWLGLLPFAGPIGLHPAPEGLGAPASHLIPLFRAPASDLNFTIALAIISVISVNFLAMAAIGIGQHARKFFNFSSGIHFFTGILELVSEFVKILSFSFRLFGNVFAGEVLLAIVGFLIPYVLPLPFIFLEIFVGFIQAFIFSMLTLVAIGMGIQHEETQHA